MPGPPKDMTTADRIRDILSEKNMSVQGLSRRTGLAYSTLQYIMKQEKGRIGKLQKIASALSVSVEDLSHHGLQMREERRKAAVLPPVRAGVGYAYPATPVEDIASIEEEKGEDIVEIPKKKSEPVSTSRSFTFRLEASDAVLERVDRVLDILEAFITTPVR